MLLTANAAWNIFNFRRPVVEDVLARGGRVTVVAPPDEAIGELRAMGCDTVPLEMNVKGLNPLTDLALMRQLRTIFAVVRPDVVLSYTIKNNIFGALAAKSVGIPFVPNVSGLGTAFLSGPVLRGLVEALYRAAFRGLPVVFFQNSDDCGLFLDRGLVRENQAQVLPGSGIDLERFAPVPLPGGDAPVYLLIARMLRDKGVLEFVEAAKIVRRTLPTARFQLLGPADSANRSAFAETTVRGWEKTHGVEYLGTAPDVRAQIAAADCVVLPSYREGAPRTLIEAAAMARPVIATDVPGCRAVVEKGVTGLMCAPRDVATLVDAMTAFAFMPDHRRTAMGLAGRALMESKFDQALVARAYREAMASITSRPLA
ncbi:glycosyltransferase family 4 protein [Novosphingobium jiangmenense]|uniref:glycosyltransferase family 4 protein n=1 Tax=Novosphingobium jiangmenense TaxID=2791981 RepID=UPI001BE3EC25